MLKRKAMKKILITTLTICLLLAIYLIPSKSKNNDKMLTGRTESNKVVNFEGSDNLIGKVINVKIISEHQWYLKGKYN